MRRFSVKYCLRGLGLDLGRLRSEAVEAEGSVVVSDDKELLGMGMETGTMFFCADLVHGWCMLLVVPVFEPSLGNVGVLPGV